MKIVYFNCTAYSRTKETCYTVFHTCVTDRLSCVIRLSDDALHRTRGDRPGGMSHATVVKLCLCDVFGWPICTIRASCDE